MSETKHIRAASRIKELAADFLERTSNHLSLITVTDIDLSPDGKTADIMISVLPESKANAAVDFANRNRDDFKNYLKDRVRLRVIPRVRFLIDMGERNRQRIEELSAEEKQRPSGGNSAEIGS